MPLRKPKVRVAVVAVIAIAILVAISVKRHPDSRPSDDLGMSEELGSTKDHNELANNLQLQTEVQEGISANAGSEPSLGQFDAMVVPVREVPSYEHPDVAAAYAGDTDALFDTLVELGMAGNAVASFNLYGFLGNCDKLYKTEDELEAAINRMYETRSTSNSSPENIDDRFVPAAFEASVRKTFAQCSVVPAETILDRDRWLRRAAQDGFPPAIEEYGNSIARERPDEAFSEYNRLWELGGAMGADKMSKMYATGWEGQEPDLVRAAAYGYIATEYMLEYFESINNVYGSTMFEEMKQDHIAIQRDYLMRLGPGEFDQAFELAQDLLSNNPNCCFN